MAQTPKSVSVNVLGTTNTTIYTVPALKTAVVKAVIGANSDSSGSTLTVSKYVAGQNYPIFTNQPPVAVNATGGTTIRGVNLLTAPITMAAGEELKAYASATSFYNLPNVATFTLGSDGSNPTVYQTYYGNGKYVSVGATASGGAFIATSTDAITWTQNTAVIPLTSQLTQVVNIGSIWVAINPSVAATILYSTDNAVTWAPSGFVAGTNLNGLAASSTTFLVSGTDNRLYYSTDGNTWTQSTSYFTTVGTSVTIRNISWSGTHWLVSNANSGLVSSDLVTWDSYTTVNFGKAISTLTQSVAWSGAYSKYYSCRNTASVPNIFSSTKGLVWTTLATITTQGVQKMACAGANTVILGLPPTGSTERYVSTNGTTFTTANDVGGYSGPVFGLDNGYYLSTGINDSSMGLSTDPTVSTGTTRGSLRAGYIKCAAADPVSGKWVAVQVGDSPTTIFIDGGTSGTNIGGTSYNTGLDAATYGTPQSVCWSSADSYFYMVTTNGYVYRFTTYNTGFAAVGIVSSPALNSSYQIFIRAVGTTLYVVAGNTGQPSTINIGSTLTGGASWLLQDFNSGSYTNSYVNCASMQRNGQYWGEGGATNGTDFLWLNNAGRCYVLTPSNGVSTMRMPTPANPGRVQTAGSYQFVYGGYDSSTAFSYGYWYSTNAITTYGDWVGWGNISDYPSYVNRPANRVAYIGSTYYIVSYASSYLYSSSTPVMLSGKGSGSSFAGVTPVMPTAGFANDGTNLAGSIFSAAFYCCKTTTPSNFLYAATVTASIVEID